MNERKEPHYSQIIALCTYIVTGAKHTHTHRRNLFNQFLWINEWIFVAVIFFIFVSSFGWFLMLFWTLLFGVVVYLLVFSKWPSHNHHLIIHCRYCVIKMKKNNESCYIATYSLCETHEKAHKHHHVAVSLFGNCISIYCDSTLFFSLFIQWTEKQANEQNSDDRMVQVQQWINS